MRPLSDADVDAEYAVLTTERGRALLEEVSATVPYRPADLARWRKQTSTEWARAAIRLVEARHKGAGKFTAAEKLWLDPVGIEQATAEIVACHKARRFFREVVVDLCCGIGGDAMALAGVVQNVIAVDLDHGMCRRVSWNAAAVGVGHRVLAVRSDAERFPRPTEMLIHIDPDRRAVLTDRRARSVRDYAPGLSFLHDLARSAPGGAIKLSPASDFDTAFTGTQFEVEVTSSNGECKEATVWFGRLAGCHRRATVLPAGASWTDRDGSPDRAPAVVPIDRWLFEPDAALIRSSLLQSFAVAHGLDRVAIGIDLLTGPELLLSPFLTAFEVEVVLPFDRKRLRRLAQDRGLGTLEIKTCGIDAQPEDLRRELRGGGTETATLFLIGGRGPARAILAHRA